MKIPEARLEEARTSGFTVVEGFLDGATLTKAQEALWQLFPTPEQYFAHPKLHERFTRSQFAGIRLFPYPSWHLNRLAVLPDLVDAAARFCGTEDLRIYKVELWAKYAGAIDYDQAHHRDYGNHTIVVPKLGGAHVQMTTFILLSDVTEADGPTKIVPLEHTRDVPLVPATLPKGALFDKEVSVTGPAGSLLIYRTDVLHRASNFTAPNRARFAMLVDFEPRDCMDRQDGVAQPVALAGLERCDVAHVAARTHALRLSGAGRSLLGCADPARCRKALSRDGHGAVSQSGRCARLKKWLVDSATAASPQEKR